MVYICCNLYWADGTEHIKDITRVVADEQVAQVWCLADGHRAYYPFEVER